MSKSKTLYQIGLFVSSQWKVFILALLVHISQNGSEVPFESAGGKLSA